MLKPVKARGEKSGFAKILATVGCFFKKITKFFRRGKIRNQALLKRGGYSLIITAIVLAVLIAFNVLMSVLSERYHLEIDMTDNAQYSMTEENIDFVEKVEIRQGYVDKSYLMNLGHIAEKLYATKAGAVLYTVVSGDSLYGIAMDHDMSIDELLALNPGYNINKLQIGEVLTLSASVPYLTMTVVQQERYVDDVQYDIEYTDSADMYQGDYRVISSGVYGKADITANVTYVNGQETDREVVASALLSEPIAELQATGTKPRPSWYPTGSFRWPTNGRVTSYFGGRKSPGGIGSTNHKGLDIANSRGTAIYAADGGTVTYAGWMGGYGYTVRVDHGNGKQTYYAHNSKLLVSVGQHVYKGQQIAKMGSTGNSTGNHCHFEVRINGVAKNPMSYLP